MKDTEIFSFKEILALSGVYDSDSEFEQQIKIDQWIGSRKVVVVESFDLIQQQLDSTGTVDIVIIKELKNEQPRNTENCL